MLRHAGVATRDPEAQSATPSKQLRHVPAPPGCGGPFQRFVNECRSLLGRFSTAKRLPQIGQLRGYAQIGAGATVGANRLAHGSDSIGRRAVSCPRPSQVELPGRKILSKAVLRGQGNLRFGEVPDGGVLSAEPMERAGSRHRQGDRRRMRRLARPGQHLPNLQPRLIEPTNDRSRLGHPAEKDDPGVDGEASDACNAVRNCIELEPGTAITLHVGKPSALEGHRASAAVPDHARDRITVLDPVAQQRLGSSMRGGELGPLEI